MEDQAPAATVASWGGWRLCSDRRLHMTEATSTIGSVGAPGEGVKGGRTVVDASRDSMADGR
jgi:hypothetical protein